MALPSGNLTVLLFPAMAHLGIVDLPYSSRWRFSSARVFDVYKKRPEVSEQIGVPLVIIHFNN